MADKPDANGQQSRHRRRRKRRANGVNSPPGAGGAQAASNSQAANALPLPGPTTSRPSPVPPSVKLHPNGERKIKIRDVQDVYDHLHEIPLEMYGKRKSWNSLVTPEDVERASDRWDGESILEDIDTQWGLIPQGGALEYCGWGSD